MYCPNCGQEQHSIETRFCNRCGMQMQVVSRLLQFGGTLPELADLKEPNWLTKKNGIGFSFMWLVVFLLLIPALAGGVLNLDIIPEFSAILGVFGSLLLFIISIFWLPSSRSYQSFPFGPNRTSPSRQNLPPEDPLGLPSRQEVPAAEQVRPQHSWRTPDTGEMAPAPSVVEETTRLFSRDDLPPES